ncbi:MAG: hypothetical protein UCO86_03970, partial [Eggerthella lenta]|nr:hypothetical protein [Eggerthella lenta]
ETSVDPSLIPYVPPWSFACPTASRTKGTDPTEGLHRRKRVIIAIDELSWMHVKQITGKVLLPSQRPASCAFA